MKLELPKLELPESLAIKLPRGPKRPPEDSVELRV